MKQPPVTLKNRPLAALLAYLVPGLGHFYQGRTGKGILYGVCILGLYLVGLAMGDWRNVFWRWVSPFQDSEHFCYYYLGQFFAGLAALPALIQATLIHYGHAPIAGGFLAEPSQIQINASYQSGKIVEMGALYTTVAGLLNILAIFDAYEGPANVAADEQALAQATAPEGLQKAGAPA